jgi:hypothetical protein
VGPVTFLKLSGSTMTTAAKPTFFPAVGGEDQGYFRMEGGTRQVSVKDLPGHTKLKLRKQVPACQKPFICSVLNFEHVLAATICAFGSDPTIYERAKHRKKIFRIAILFSSSKKGKGKLPGNQLPLLHGMHLSLAKETLQLPK